MPKKTINQALALALEIAAKMTDEELLDEENIGVMEVDEETKAQDERRRKEEEARRPTTRPEDDRNATHEVLEYELDKNCVLPRGNMVERAKYIPLRLSYLERKHLRLVNGSINVSDYTSCVDRPFKSRTKRHHCQLQNICAFLSGLIASADYSKGQEILDERNFGECENFIKAVLEIARRYKITNPEKMRSEYGKLVLLMQDAISKDVKPLLGVDISQPVRTVYDLLSESGGLKVLEDRFIEIATQEILPDKRKSRSQIQAEIKLKEKAINKLHILIRAQI